MEQELINKADFLPYRAISDNIETMKRISPHIIEAQRLDLMQWLGSILYYKLIENTSAYAIAKAADADYIATPEQQVFLDLLNGVTYKVNEGTNEEVTKIYPGLKPVLVYLTYKRFVNRDNIRSTPSGFTVKVTQESTPITAKQITEEAGRAEDDAHVFYNYAIEFMRDKKTDFGKYNSVCHTEDNQRNGTRLSAARNRCATSRRFNRNERY